MFKRLTIIFSLLLICFIPSAMLAMETAPAGILYTKPIESVIFSHQDHLQKGASCNTCHSGLFAMEALKAQKNKDFTMDSLYQGKYCGACHNGKKAFASDTQCARCHLGSGVPTPPKDTPAYQSSVTLGKGEKGVAFNHDTHVKKATCQSCHPSLFKPKAGAGKISMSDHGQDKYCFTCHDQKGENAFAWTNCGLCHKKSVPAPKETITFGKESKMGAVAFRHESHQPQAGCKACHPQPFSFKKGTVKIGFGDHTSGKSCFICHAQKNGTASYACNHCHKK
jgi:c(7)-type cytochrome triheme protein